MIFFLDLGLLGHQGWLWKSGNGRRGKNIPDYPGTLPGLGNSREFPWEIPGLGNSRFPPFYPVKSLMIWGWIQGIPASATDS